MSLFQVGDKVSMDGGPFELVKAGYRARLTRTLRGLFWSNVIAVALIALTGAATWSIVAFAFVNGLGWGVWLADRGRT
jgi:hypothetical protein